MKLSLPKETTINRKKKAVFVVSAQSKRDEVQELSSEIALELSHAKSTIRQLKEELAVQGTTIIRKLTSDFEELRRAEILKKNDQFEVEKQKLIGELSQKHTQRVNEICKEYENQLQEIKIKYSLGVRPNTYHDHPQRFDDDLIDEQNRQDDRDSGLLEPPPYDPEYEW